MVGIPATGGPEPAARRFWQTQTRRSGSHPAAALAVASSREVTMTWIRNLGQHPWRNAGLAVLIGVVSFVVASTALPQGNVPWTAIFWFLIPLIMLIGAITLAMVGIRHRKASRTA